MNILVTGVRAPMSLDVIRALAQAGHQVWASDALRFPIAKNSPYINAYLRTAAPRLDFISYAKNIIDICEQCHIDMIIPTCEEVFWLAKIKSLPAFTQLQSVGLQQLLQLHHKAQFAELANQLGCGAGAFFTVLSQAEIQQKNHEINWVEYVAKPVYSRFSSQTLVSPSVKEISHITPSAQQPWLLQKRIIGREICLYCVANSGVLLTFITYVPQFRTNQHGASLYFQPIEVDGAAALAAAFIKASHYTGQISFDVIISAQGLVAIECNPRGTSGAHLLAQHNQQYADALIGHVQHIKPSHINLKPMMLLLPLLMHYPTALFKREQRDLLKQAKNVTREHQVSFGNACLAMIEIIWIALKNRISLGQASTFDIEWNGELNE